MKNILFLFAVILLFFTSCSDDLLGKEPLDIVSDAFVWDDIATIESHLAGAYSMMSVLENEQPEKYVGIRNGVGWTLEGQMGASIVNNIADEGRWGFYPMQWDFKFNLDINGGLLEWWDNGYVVIRHLNVFIEKVSDSPINDGDKAHLLAEARFLRAYNYFALVKRHGGVPLILKAQNLDDSEESLYPMRNTEKEVYDFIISEIDATYADMPGKVVAGRASKYALLALKSRAALYAASIAEYGEVQLNGIVGIPSEEAQTYYQKSYDASEIIMNAGVHHLYNVNPDKAKNFREIFMVKDNPEAIFVAAHNNNDMIFAGGNGWYWDFQQAPLPHGWGNGNQNQPYLSFIESTFEKVNGTAPDLSEETLTSKLWDVDELWGEMEPRFFGTIYTQGTPFREIEIDWHKGLIVNDEVLSDNEGAYNGVPHLGLQAKKNGPFTSFGLLKYLDEDYNALVYSFASKQDWQVFRYAEILLNHAEAAFKLGKTGEALSDINLIRDRAGVAARVSITNELIRKERKVELAFEGHRYWDVRRWRIAETKLTERQTGLIYFLDYETQKLKLEIVQNIDGGDNVSPSFHKKNYYFPITLNRTQQNTNLVENPGYN